MKRDAGILWEEVKSGSNLFLNDFLYSGKRSLRYHYLKKDIVITLAPDTTIRIKDVTGDNPVINFSGVGVSVSGSYAGNLKVTDGINTKELNLRDKKEVSFKKNYDNVLVAIENQSGEKVFRMTDEALKKLGVDVNAVGDILKNAEPAKGNIINYDNDVPDLLFSWDLKDENYEGTFETIEISRSPNFIGSIKYDIDSQRDFTLEEEIAEGAWYWRLRGPGFFTETKTFYLRNNKRIFNFRPYIENKDSIHNEVTDLMLASHFFTEEEKVRVFFKTETQGVFDKKIVVVDNKTKKKYEIDVKNSLHSRTLPLGEYTYYMIDAFTGKRLPMKRKRFFTINSFHKVSLLEPQNGATIDVEKRFKKSEITFKWTGSERLKGYRFQLSKYKSTKRLPDLFEREIIVEKLIEDNQVTIDLRYLTENSYYWRVIPNHDAPGVLVSEAFKLNYIPEGVRSKFNRENDELEIAKRLRSKYYRVKFESASAKIDFSDGQSGAKGRINAYNYNARFEARPHVEKRSVVYYADVEWSRRGSIPNSNIGADNFVNAQIGIGYTVPVSKSVDITPRIYVYRDNYYTGVQGTDVSKKGILGLKSEIMVNYENECSDNYRCFSRATAGISNNITGDFGSDFIYGIEAGITKDHYEVYLFYKKDGVDFGEINNSNKKLGLGVGVAY